MRKNATRFLLVVLLFVARLRCKVDTSGSFSHERLGIRYCIRVLWYAPYVRRWSRCVFFANHPNRTFRRGRKRLLLPTIALPLTIRYLTSIVVT
jgi:hypothetical protein